jgi:hypothetical protein
MGSSSERNRLNTAAESLLWMPRKSSSAEIGGSAYEELLGAWSVGGARSGGKVIRSDSAESSADNDPEEGLRGAEWLAYGEYRALRGKCAWSWKVTEEGGPEIGGGN